MLGIIGGMGPEASCYFYENVIAHTKAEKDQEHIDMVLLSHAIHAGSYKSNPYRG